MKRLLAFFALTAALTVSAAQAQQPSTYKRWVPMGTTTNEYGASDAVYIDRETIQYRPSDTSYVSVWLLLQRTDGSHRMDRLLIHRTTRRYRTMAATEYGPAGNLLDTTSKPSGAWEDAVPGSIAENVFHVFDALDEIRARDQRTRY